jgi:2-oxoglutarate dehydrogenase E1 component
MIEAPVFHVNGDSSEAAINVMRLALKYRQKFRKDVVIDLVCYRRHGHNEADEPSATQPVMYSVIRKHKTTRALYAQQLVGADVIDDAAVSQLQEDYRDRLDRGEPVPDSALGMIGNEFTVDWHPYLNTTWDDDVDTTLSPVKVAELAGKLTTLPPGYALHGRVQRIIDDRKRMGAGEIDMDWGFAESMAYAGLLDDGYECRITGQDSGRGTFFHRHAVLHEQNNRQEYIPLQHITDKPSAFRVLDSLLSEEAVMAFEYGYATTEPGTLVVWEGQFGDFANGAQVVIDQFISSGDAKWGRQCGLTLFLPHGHEGQGPEHSSARLERFLQLCAEHNMQVCVPSTPAQMFHMIRRQMIRPYRKPLIVLTPKSLLRHKASVSTLSSLSTGQFEVIIPDTSALQAEDVTRVIFCSGKVYYDLIEAREVNDLSNVAIVRIEQLYPFAIERYASILESYPNITDVVWCQEEPQNQGAWYQIRHRLQEPLSDQQELFYAGRSSAAAPASGIYKLHLQQQQALVEAALDVEVKARVAKKQPARKRKSK